MGSPGAPWVPGIDGRDEFFLKKLSIFPLKKVVINFLDQSIKNLGCAYVGIGDTSYQCLSCMNIEYHNIEHVPALCLQRIPFLLLITVYICIVLS